MNIIKTDNLTKIYGKSRGAQDVNLEVKEGEIYGFIGPNGAGKSTTIKLLLNFIFPTSGTASILEKDVVTQSKEIKKSIGYVPSEVRYYGNLTGEEIIKATMNFHHCTDTTELDLLCERLDIDKKKKISELSLGNRKKIAIACAIIHSPKLIILDEPTSGLDPLIQKKLFEILKEKNKAGATIFISSHNLNEIEEHCTKVAFIKDGEIFKIIEMDNTRVTTKIIIITGNSLDVSVFENNEFIVISNENNVLKLAYKGDVQNIVKLAASQQISDITIENLSLEDEFLTYYEVEKK